MMKKSLFVKIKTVEPVSMLFYHLVNTEAGAHDLYLSFPVLTFLKWLLIKSKGGVQKMQRAGTRPGPAAAWPGELWLPALKSVGTPNSPV